jgi:hypothetical protein
MKRLTRRTDLTALGELKQSLHATRSALEGAYAAFDYASDPELTEACIFEIRSLQARMNYLVRQIKALDEAEVS